MDNIERGERRTTRRRIHNNVLAGIILLIIGSALLMKKMDYPFPNWLFSWPMILILVGLFIGIVNRFRDIGWLIICGVGFFFLADKIWPSFDVKDFIWPGIIILVGLALLIRPRLSSGDFLWKVKTNSSDDDIDQATLPFKRQC